MWLLLASSVALGRAPGDLPTALRHQVALAAASIVAEEAWAGEVDFARAHTLIAAALPRISEARTETSLAAAITDALAPLGVSHLAVYTPTDTRYRSQGRALWAGVTLLPDGDGLVVSRVVPDSPAARAGLVRGDRVIAVDGERVRDGAVSGVRAGKLRPDGASRHRVVWVRGGQQLEAAVGVDDVEVAPPVSLGWEGQVAWLAVGSFRRGSYDRAAVDAAFSEVARRGAVGLVLDLRGNGGGLVEHTHHLLQRLVPAGTISTVTRRPEPGAPATAQPEVLVAEGGPVYGGPVVVLVDSNSASGGELVPAVLHDLRGAVVVGLPTAGALLEGLWRELPGGFWLLYPVALVARPDGRTLESRGVTPDLALDPVSMADEDAVRSAALAAMPASGG